MHRIPSSPQEALVHDVRAALTPAQMVERKLSAMLRGNIVPASHLQISVKRRTLS